ncbi:hypothetical protein GpartN1_g5059.t1 [Galdieria partita]|uniref:Uncharacterized protein n=1 Tax=Galdieria partita TaxID=83374 RepID=A0A9C7URX6_9RHOD|nr:hypothetical protein GpartN1_g5059.t1 [Galdieria partita]
MMRKFRHSIYHKRTLRFFVIALIATLTLFSTIFKLGGNLQLKNSDLLGRFPTLLEKYGADSQVLKEFLQKRAKGLQDWKHKDSNHITLQNTKDNNELPRNNVQALLEDSSTSELSSSTELYLKKQQHSDEKSQTHSTEKQQTTSSEEESTTSSSDDKIALEVEKTEYWNQLYKTNGGEDQSQKQFNRDQKPNAAQEDTESNSNQISKLSLPNPQDDVKELQDTKGSPLKGDNLFNEKDSHLELVLEASRLQAKFGDCDNYPAQASDLPENIKQTWCQMKGVDKDYVRWGIEKLEEMFTFQSSQ